MKKRRLWIRTAVLCLLAAAVGFSLYANFTKGDVQKVEIGEKAPDFELIDLNGEKHRLSDYEGQGVFLNFWGSRASLLVLSEIPRAQGAGTMRSGK